MQIEHIGYAVKNMDEAIATFISLGFAVSDVSPDEYRNVDVVIAEMGGVKLELLSPIEGKKSPIDSYLKIIGSAPYHICYRVDDIWKGIDELQNKGFTLINDPADSVPLKGKVAFLYSPEIGLTELFCRKRYTK